MSMFSIAFTIVMFAIAFPITEGLSGALLCQI